jgi:hypothetical protein
MDLPLLRKHVSLTDRIMYGERFYNRKKIAPTRPHPTAPDKPGVLGEAMGLMMAPIDKFRDVFRNFPAQSRSDFPE